MFCKHCGTKLEDGVTVCPSCGTDMEERPAAENLDTVSASEVVLKAESSANTKKYIILGIAVIVILVLILKIGGGSKCAVSGCNNKVERGEYCSVHVCHYANCEGEAMFGNYCINHVCLYGNCTNPRNPGGQYCSYHESSMHNPYSDLSISSYVVNPYGSNYTKCSGTITNIGNITYRFVQVKGAFKDSAGKVVDTDWTYAVGSEGLAPGESKTFEMWIDKKSGISSCDVSIIDYSN